MPIAAMQGLLITICMEMGGKGLRYAPSQMRIVSAPLTAGTAVLLGLASKVFQS